MEKLNIGNLKLNALDSNHIIIDIGQAYTKCGFVNSVVPMFIIPTALEMINSLRNNISSIKLTSFAEAYSNDKLVYREVEEFLAEIFYHVLQTSPKEKAVVIVESFYGPRKLTEAIGACLFKSYGCKSVYFVLSNVLPLYTTGMESGIVVDAGFQQV